MNIIRLVTFCVLVFIVAAAAYAQPNQDVQGVRTVEALTALRDRNLDFFFSFPGVYGVGVRAGAIDVYIDKHLYADNTRLDLLMSSFRTRVGFATDLLNPIRIQEIQAFSSTAAAMGSSTSNTAGCFIGTLGVTAKRNGQIGYITCNHVAAAEENRICANVGNAKRQVSPASGDQPHCKDGARIGRLEETIPIHFSGNHKNYVDAAFVAQRGVGVHPLNRCGIVWTSTIVPAVQGMRVQKCGAATDLQEGDVWNPNAVIKVSYRCGMSTLFYDQIVIKGSGFSAAGDSGSVVFTKNGEVVGLLFAGEPDWTIVNPMQHVVDELKVQLCPYPCR